MAKSPVPKGYSAVMPYLRIKGAADAIAFYTKAFGAKERFRLVMGDRIGHAEIDIGGAAVMLSDEFPEMQVLGPRSLGGTSIGLLVYVSDVDKAVAKAVATGGTVRRPAKDEFYGDRTAQIEDPFGHVWFIQQRIEDVSPKEMQKRLDAMMAGGGAVAEKVTPKPRTKKKS